MSVHSAGRQVLAFPVQTGGLTPATVLKAANIKTEVGLPTTTIIQQRATPMVIGGSPVVVMHLFFYF